MEEKGAGTFKGKEDPEVSQSCAYLTGQACDEEDHETEYYVETTELQHVIFGVQIMRK